ncbi:MAG: metallophosphoesterase family protein [Candidatus Thorarchaeota archaeon]|nr:MAG: metallophosphoesterase family protein [Candidatus Thorarchaeota archaeon]
MVDRLAVISDIHGNRWALEVVLEEIHELDVDCIVNLGDSLYGPLDPSGTFEILLDRGIMTVAGNEDRIISDSSIDPGARPTLEYVRGELDSRAIAWLEGLPATARIEYAFAFHGTPMKDDEYLLEKVSDRRVSMRSLDEVAAMVSGIQNRLILCGHSHQPNTILLESGQVVVNPGSVGLQAYTDDTPFPHMMETGIPHAQYSIVELDGEDVEIGNLTVSYDWDAAASQAVEQGRSDWADWLRTGKAD